MDVLFGAEGLIKEESCDPTTCRKVMGFTKWDEFPSVQLIPMPSQMGDPFTIPGSVPCVCRRLGVWEKGEFKKVQPGVRLLGSSRAFP